LEETANETTAQVLSAWDDYKIWQKARLKTHRDNLKSYNTNMNQTSTIYLSETEESITDWTISIHTINKSGLKSWQIPVDSMDKSVEKVQNKHILDEIEKNLSLAQSSKMPRKDSLRKWDEKIVETDSLLVNTFRFKTAENQ